MKVDSVRELVTMIKKDKSLEEEIRKDPAKAIAKIKITESPLKEVPSDIGIYRIVVSALGLTVLLVVSGGIYLAANKVTPTPEILIALGSTAVGALAGLLAPTHGSK